MGLIVYTYVGYPLLLWLWTRVWHLPIPQQFEPTDLPFVSVIVAAHDEEAVIVDKLLNCAALDYPADRIEFLIGSDGSLDATATLASAHAGPNLKLLAFPRWRGKAAVVNDLVAVARGDILVFTDANTVLEPPAIRRLVRHFGNPHVGGVGGQLVLRRARLSNSRGTADEALYWRYESWIKAFEGQLGLLAATPGALHAQRRALVQPVPTLRLISDDLYLSGNVLLQGHAVTYEPTAVAYEGVSSDTRTELKRKIRVAETGYNVIPYLWPLLLPWRGRVAWMFWSHKMLRWLVPFLLLLIVGVNLLLLNDTFYRFTFITQMVLYGAAWLGYRLEGRWLLPWWLSFPYYFAGANLALLVGCVRSMTRPATAIWGRVAR